ncbi:tautomerase family protein [Bacillus toyonensis]|uniref:tautomerase family protein n=1 Tax=Bacillus toyonensis TaxID=155322 RepID=UPI0036A5E215
MPFVTVYHPEELSDNKLLKNVSIKIHHSLMEHFNIPENDYFQMFLPYASHQLFYDSSYLLEDSTKQSNNMIYVSITCGPGRTMNQKKDLYNAIATTTATILHISSADVFITLHETSIENWSFGQGIAQMLHQHNN